MNSRLAVQNQQAATTPLTVGIKEAWKRRCSSLSEDEKIKFESLACNGLSEYMEKLEAACSQHRDSSVGFKILDWFEPLFKAVQLLTPAASIAIQAYPNPGSLVLGGIVGLLETTNRLLYYQKATLHMLNRMGKKASILLLYERELYEDDEPTQRALVEVYGDIIVFVQKAIRFVTDKGILRAKVKGLALTLFRDFEVQLGNEVEDFEHHMEHLESRAAVCDKRRIKQLQDRQRDHHKEFGEMVDENRGQFEQQNELLTRLERKMMEAEERVESRHREKNQRRMLNWLSPLNFEAPYTENCKKHLPRTGSWFLACSEYKNWKSNDRSDLLWIRGKPGSGKSVLATVTIAADLKVEFGQGTAFAFAFCQRELQSSQNSFTVLGALAKQIIQGQSGSDPVLEREFNASDPAVPPNEKTVRMIMKSALSRATKTVLVIDGLDECKNNHELAQELLELMEDTWLPSVKTLIFSRQDLLVESFNPYQQLFPDQGGNKDDLEAYIHWCFPDDRNTKTNKEIRKKCIEKADGMFLWVDLLSKSLRKGRMSSAQKLQMIEDTTPGDLENMYDRMLQAVCELSEDVRRESFLVLMWVIHARRPLHRLELLEAIAVRPSATKIEDLDDFKHDTPEDFVANCANLISIDKDGYFRLCHESVRGYLDRSDSTSAALSEYRRCTENTQQRMAETCLTYLLLREFECGPAPTERKLTILLKKHPFLVYAAEFWGRHISDETEIALYDLIRSVVLSETRRELSMQVTLWDPNDKQAFWDFTNSSNPLHILALYGLKQTADTLSHAMSLWQEPDGSGMMPLSYALNHGHHEMSLWLIDQLQPGQETQLKARQKIAAIHHGALRGWVDVLKRLTTGDRRYLNSKLNDDGRTPLTEACLAGQLAAASVLIENKADVNLKDGCGDSPLLISSYICHKNLVHLLLENGADPNSRDSDGATPLHYASKSEDPTIAMALLAKGADPIAKASRAEDQTPLHIAAELQAVEVIKTLYQSHNGLDLRSTGGCTPLHIAAWHNSAGSAKVLIGLGVAKDAVDKEGQSALFIAAQQGALDTVKVLLDAGCDVTIPTSDKGTALHAAANSGKFSIVHCILRKQPFETWKTLLNLPDKDGKTPLHSAICGGSAKIVEFFLKYGADATTMAFLKSSPLHYAAHFGHKEMSRLLLERTGNANPKNENEETPLHFAARSGKIEFIIQLFKDCDSLGIPIQINLESKWNKTALMISLGEQHEKIAKILIEKGALSVPDTDGNHPIHLAAWHGFDDVVQLLLTQDGLRSRGFLKRTPLFCAAVRGHLKTVKLLAPLCKDILDVPDKAGATPILAAESCRHTEIAKFLLDEGADHSAADEKKDTLLHWAALVGDLNMVRRVLDLKVNANVANYFGDTPFHRAVEADSLEIVQEFIDRDYDAINITNATGDLCSFVAARQGNLEMLRLLDGHGARYDRNLMDRTATLAAAGSGHFDILEFLEANEPNPEHLDLEGNHPLIFAAAAGYPATVKHLLRSQRHLVNVHNKWERATPLSAATRRGYTLVMKLLLDAGADPMHRDEFGLNAFDYASQNHKAMLAINKAGHFYSGDGVSAARPLFYETIRACCESIENSPSEPSVEQLYHRLSQVISLGGALTRIRDFDAAKLCYMELLWDIDYDLLSVSITCDICNAKRANSAKYVCKSCFPECVLCEPCYKDYENAGNKVPTSLTEIDELEREMQPIRSAIPEDEDWSLEILTRSMMRFELGSNLVSSALSRYEAWEKNFNTDSRFSELQRPGQEFLKLVKAMYTILEIATGDGTESADMEKLNQEYTAHRRKHRADKEIREVTCKDHEYFIVEPDEKQKLKAVGAELDSKTGKLTASFARKIREKYSIPSDDHGSIFPLRERTKEKESSVEKAPPDVRPSNGHTSADTANQGTESRPDSLKRAFTFVGKPRAALWDDSLELTASTAKSPLPAMDIPLRPVRSQSLPFPSRLATSTRTYSVGVGAKPAQLSAAVEALVDPDGDYEAFSTSAADGRLTKRNTANIVLGNGPQLCQDQRTGDLLPESNGIKSSPDESAFKHESISGLELTSDPEPIMNGQMGGASGTPNETGTMSEPGGVPDDPDAPGQDLERSLRTAYMLYVGRDDEEDMVMWLRSLHIMGVMVPGFVEYYFQCKQEEQDEQADESNRLAEAEDVEEEDSNEEDDDTSSDADE